MVTVQGNQQAGITKRIGVITAQFGALVNDTPRLADYRSFRAPVLMIAGSEMQAPVRRIGELLRLALPNATFDTFSAIGHMGPITHSSVVAQRIAEFVRGHAFVSRPVARELAA